MKTYMKSPNKQSSQPAISPTQNMIADIIYHIKRSRKPTALPTPTPFAAQKQMQIVAEINSIHCMCGADYYTIEQTKVEQDNAIGVCKIGSLAEVVEILDRVGVKLKNLDARKDGNAIKKCKHFRDG